MLRPMLAQIPATMSALPSLPCFLCFLPALLQEQVFQCLSLLINTKPCNDEEELEKPEADIARVSPWRYLRNSFIYTSLPVENHSFEYESLLTSYDQFPLPPWISEQDIKYYETDFATSGFTGPLNYYRALDRTWELMAPWTKGKVIVPTLYMVGDGDVVYNGFPGAKDYIHKGMKTDVPNLKGVIVLEGLHHFLHEEKSEVVTEYILKFLKSFLP